MNTFFSRVIVCLATILTFASCDKDINEVGANIVGENHFGFSSDVSSTVLAYTQKTDEVDTSNLLVNQLGIYDSPTFGKTTASVAVELSLTAPVVVPALSTQVINSVVLDIPYYSTDTGKTDILGIKLFTINDFIGNKDDKIKLSVFRSTKDIGGVFPTTSINNRFFSNTIITTSGVRYNDLSNMIQNDEFVFNASANGNVGPSMNINLNNSLATEILSLGTTTLSSNANFAAVFKGLYLKVEQSGINPGCMALLNLAKGTVTIKYSQSINNATATDETITLSTQTKSVNVLEQINTPNYNTKINIPNTVAGDDRLYLKGGNGSVAYINLFGNTNVVSYDRLNNKIVPRVAGDANDTPDELDYLKAKGLIINEANLIFTVDNAAMGSSTAPARIFIYNANNKKQLIDYNEDNTINPLKGIHDGIIQKVTGSNDKYRIRVTNHIRNLINKDSTNVRLAVAVTRDISAITFNANKNASYLTGFQWSGLPVRDRLDFTAKFFPVSSISSPLGTVLYGSNVSAADNDKKLKLEIWYTKPN